MEEAQPCELCHRTGEQKKASDGFAENAQTPQTVTIEDYDCVSFVARYDYQHAPLVPGQSWTY